MPKKFNVTGICIPGQDYMADISKKLDCIITDYIEPGKYFTINRARQYGKTTTLYLLGQRLKDSYIVIRLSFEAADEMFVSLYTFAAGLVRKISRILRQLHVDHALIDIWDRPISREFPFDDLSVRITSLCQNADKDIILIIDEVDKNSGNQIFLSFLGLLRSKYLEQMQKSDDTFKSVILAGVYDIKNMKLKLHPGSEEKYNSPWNVSADFTVDMSLQPKDIASMLQDYETDHFTGMDIAFISRLIYDYTSGYPYLVSRICQLADERLPGTEAFPDMHHVWTRAGIAAAELLLRKESNTLFDDLVKKLADFPKLKQMLQDMLFCGNSYPFEKENPLINLGVTFGFLKEKNGTAVIGNRIFETKLYDLFICESVLGNTLYQASSIERNQFIVNGTLQMKLVMEKFYSHFTEILQSDFAAKNSCRTAREGSFMEKIIKWLHWICRILELIVAIFVLVGIILSIFSLFKDDASIFKELTSDISIFRHYLETIFALVIGIEFLEMLCHPNSDNVIQVLIFLVARHMIVGETSPYEDFISVLSVTVLFLLRKYMHHSDKADGHEADSISETKGDGT